MELPVFNALIENFDEGIYNISLVDCPAVESNFIAFEKDKAFQSYSIENEEQHMICGCLMRCEYLIYRRDKSFGEYYIKYDKETIKKMAEKLMSDGNQNNVNVMHLPDSNVDGVQMVEIFIKDTEKGINPKGFEDISDGSLFATFKVHNEDVWNAIKDGTFKGYSLEGVFTVEQKLNKINNNKNIFMKIKEMLRNILVQLGSVIANDGTEIEFEGDVLEVGTAVNVADGEYEIGDKVYVIVDGKVAEIKDKEEEPVVEETVDETVEEVEYEVPEVTEEVVDEPNEVENDALKGEVEALKAQYDALQALVEELSARVEELISTPVATPVEEAFEKIEETENTRFASLADMISKNRK